MHFEPSEEGMILYMQTELIKYLEDKIKKLKDECASYGHLIDKDTIHKFELQINDYQDILERLKSGKYE